MEEEIWKDIIGYEGLYQISNLGRVKTVDRFVDGRMGRTPYFRKSHFMKPNLKNTGYMEVGLCKDGKTTSYRIHRLVATHFIPNPNEYPIINHKNEVKTDNRAVNLEWCTPLYNDNYGNRNQKLREALTKDRGKVVVQIDSNGEIIGVFPTITIASIMTGIQRSGISAVVNKRKHKTGYAKTAGGYKWKFKDEK